MMKMFLKASGIVLMLVGITTWAAAQTIIKGEDSKKNIGKTVTVCGKIFTSSYLDKTKTKPTLLNLGGAYPDQMLTIMIPEEYRKNFSFKPEDYFVEKVVCVTGKIIDYKGNPEIIITSPSEIILSADYIVPDNTKMPELASTTPAPVAQTNDVFTLTLTNAVNVRAQPSTRSDNIVTIANIGTTVNVHSSSNGWSYVSVEIYNKQLNKNEIVNGYIKNNVLK
jgi:hypothetical protein